MTTIPRRPRQRSRLLAALLTLGFVFCAAAPAQAEPVTTDIVDSTGQSGRTVALAFDDGPDLEDTPALLAVLGRHQAKAVFCLWGDHVRQHPDIVR